jgi:oxygen-independent coproporphyrinogen III oxidase
MTNISENVLDIAKYRIDQFMDLQNNGMIPLSGEFYPAGVHYPPITMYPYVTQESFFNKYIPDEKGKYDIYVHIPFCRQKCWFCHYPSKYSAKDTVKDEYLDALEKEMRIYTDVLGQGKIKARSVLIGGGTPTDLSPKQLKRFLSYFSEIFDLSEISQFNYDVDPITLVGDEGIERLKIMKNYGVDRLTIGVQSFDDTVLKKMNRSHDVNVAYDSIENAKKLKYDINIEFIYGHPGQTINNWIKVIDSAIKTDVDEIQLYRLKIYPYGDQEGTVYKNKYNHSDEYISHSLSIFMKEYAISTLKKYGYNENLRRVFTKNKKIISKYAYNQCCQLKEEIGFGLTAFSSLNNRFSLNTQSFQEYFNNINNNKLPINRGIIRNDDEQIRWSIILPLKNYWISKNIFKKKSGYSINNIFKEKFDKLKKHNLIEEDNARIYLTDKGSFFADEVVMQFENIKYIPFGINEYVEGELNPYNYK